MKSILSDLTRKLLRSKSTIQRIEIASQLFQLLGSADYFFGPTEHFIREHFMTRVKAFAMNPTAKMRTIITKLSNFYAKNYSERPDFFPFAA